jgi:redox-sensitive bicupin YhaK (pirin superfamily)
MDAPVYLPLTKDDTPTLISEDQATTIQVIAGSLAELKGPIVPQSPINMFTIKMKAGATYFIPFESTHQAFIYVLNGLVSLSESSNTNNALIKANYMAILHRDGDGINIIALEDSLMLMGTGEPLNEPVASHGPFVMNNQTEIMEAFRDYQMGKMGVLIED